MATVKKTPASKVMDVSHPKDSRPAQTSKPVIITNRSMITEDPMIAQAASEAVAKKTIPEDASSSDPAAPEAESEKVVNRQAKTIKPVTTAAEPTAEVEVAEPETTAEETAPEPPAAADTPARAPGGIEITQPSETKLANETRQLENKEPTEQAVEVDEPEVEIEGAIETEDDDDSPHEKTSEEKRYDDLEALVASKKYAVPIGVAAKQKARLVLWMLLVVVLAALLVDLLLDMGIIELSLPHTTFFST